MRLTKVKAQKVQGGCYPIPAQQLLLKAALLKGEKAIAAWQSWQLDRDMEDLDIGSYRLLPLLYQNLILHEVKHPFLAKMKGVYRYTWSQNQLLLSQLDQLLNILGQVEIKTMVLKGAALVNLYYKNYGLRPMADFDILIPKSEVSEVIKILKEQDWVTENGTMPTIPELSASHACMFKNSSGQQLDLHWYLLLESLRYQDHGDIWQKAIPIQVQNSHSLALNPTDQLFHVCVHGAVWNQVPPLRWVADAMTILKPETGIDWERLAILAQHYRLVLPVQDTFLFLRNVMDVSIPQSFLENLKSVPISLSAKVEYHKRIHPHNTDNYYLIDSPVGIFRNYLASVKSDYQNYANQPKKQVQFLKFLQAKWQLENIWSLPVHGTYKLIRMLRRMLYSLWVRVDT